MNKEMLDQLSETIKNIPQHPITQLDEVNTILHIYAVREEISRSIDEKYKKDCQSLLNELEIHLKELQRKSDGKWLSY